MYPSGKKMYLATECTTHVLITANKVAKEFQWAGKQMLNCITVSDEGGDTVDVAIPQLGGRTVSRYALASKPLNLRELYPALPVFVVKRQKVIPAIVDSIERCATQWTYHMTTMSGQPVDSCRQLVCATLREAVLMSLLGSKAMVAEEEFEIKFMGPVAVKQVYSNIKEISND